MTWTASLISYGRDPQYPAVATAVVDFTNGTATDRQTFRGVATQDQLNRCIRDQLAVHATIDALAARLTPGAIDPYAPVLTDAQIAGIRGLVTDWTQTDDALAASCNAATVNNPAPQSQILAPLTVLGVFGLLSQPSQGRLATNPNAATIRNDIRAQDREAVVTWAAAMAAAGSITADEYTAIHNAVSATIADPAWTATVPALGALFGRPITAADVAVARPAS